MHPKRRTTLITTLARDIEQVGPEFERFAAIVMGAITSTRMTHAGVNLRGYPVSGMVDSESDDGRLGIEYSDRKDYFEGSMEKAENDLRKLLKDCANAEHFYLVTGERRRPKKASDFTTRVRSWKELNGKALSILGSEEIATEIVDHLLDDAPTINKITPYLANLQRIVDEQATAALIPTLPSNAFDRPDIDKEITSRLGAHPVLTISGMGGLGKSFASMAYADAHRDDYQVRIWLDGEEVKRAENLKAFPLVRAGDLRNIASLLEAGDCLLVIDDARQDLSIETLTRYCGNGSHVVLTRRLIPPGAYEPPLLSKDEARAMLATSDPPCPPKEFETVWDTVDGHALSLFILRAHAERGIAWEELAEDCLAVGALGKFTDEHGVRLVDRLLKRLETALGHELSVFQWADLPAVNTDFLTQVVTRAGVRNLSAFGLTSIDRGGVVRLHDVVFTALRSLSRIDAARSEELNFAARNFIGEVAQEPGLRMWSFVRSMMPKLEDLVTCGHDDGTFLYALLAVWESDEVRKDLVGDPHDMVDRIIGRQRSALAVITIIEAIEQLFLNDKNEGDRVAQSRLEHRLPIFQRLASISDLTSRERSQIQHHEGKALRRLNRTGEATKRFEAVLAGPYPMDEASLQLVTIYRGDPEKADKTVELVDSVFARVRAGEDVAYSVILGLVERLPAGEGDWRNDVISRHAEVIKTTIVKASNEGVGQGPRAFAPLARFISTEMPDLFQSIFSELPRPAVDSLESDSDRFAWAEIYSEAARIYGSDSVALRTTALGFHDAIEKKTDFHLQRRAELLLDLHIYSEAETTLFYLSDRKPSEWIDRLMARARLALGDPSGALKLIDQAILQLRAEHFRSEFLELRYDIRLALADELASEDLVRAIAASQKTAESKRLKQRQQSCPERQSLNQ